jgi:prevent-host-death family protein
MKNMVNIHEAKTQLSRIVEEVAAGAEFVIAKAGKPMARLSPMNALPKAKKLGQLKGKIRVPDDFNALLTEEILGQFEGR